MRPLLVALLLVAACSDTTLPYHVDRSCAQLTADFTAEVSALPTWCTTDADCAGIGGIGDDTSCGCGPDLPAYAVNRAAYGVSDARRTADDFYLACNDDPSVQVLCDALPVRATCTNGVCAMSESWCPEPLDGGL